MPIGVAEKTFRLWQSMLDPNNIWLKAEIVDRCAVRIWCSLCTKHAERLRGFRNWSDVFTERVGLSGACVKKDTVAKQKQGICVIYSLHNKWPVKLHKYGDNS